MTKVAIQGIAGSYSEEAARHLLGEDAAIVECRDFDEVFAMLREGHVDTAVVPTENKIVGPIKRPRELIDEGRFRSLNSWRLKIEHVLVAPPGTRFEEITNVRSHPEALKQCNKFFADNAQLRAVDCRDTASGIKEVVERSVSKNAAVGSRRAVEMYGGIVLRENIANEKENWTKFVVIGN